MSVLKHLIGSPERRFDGPWGPWDPYRDGRIPPPGLDAVSSAGVVVTEQTAMHIIDVYACVSLRADSILMLPAKAYRKAGDVRSDVTPAPPLIAQPDPEMTANDYWAAVETSLMLRGNAYSVIIERDTRGYATAVKLIHPDDVHPERNRATGRIQYRLANGDMVDKIDMIHVSWVRLPGEIEGLSPIGCARRGLGKAIATENFGANWFRDGASPSSVLESDLEVNKTEAKRIVADWMMTHGGRRRPAVLSGGLKWRPITITPEESQFLETCKANTAQIARLFRIAPHMIGEVDRTTSWGKGIEEQGIGYVVYTLGPSITRYEVAYGAQLPRPQYVKFSVGALLRGNTKDRFVSYAVARQWGWMSVNEIRALEDLPPVEGGDVYLQPLNMIDAQDALKALLQPAPAGGDTGGGDG